MKEFLLSSIFSTTLIGALFFLLKNWLVEKLKISFSKELEQFKAELLWDKKVKEQAEKVAKYLSIARDLCEEKSTRTDFSFANQLSWELAMWLPEDIYKAAVKSIINRTKDTNELSTIISVRRLLLKEEAGNLTQNDIAVHGPGIGNASFQ